MEQRIYHGKISPDDLARSLIATFHRGNLQVQQLGRGDKIAVQISSSPRASSGGQTALGIEIQRVPDGVAVQVGKQAWMGIAADLGMTALAALHNPLSLLTRLDDVAQNVEYITLCEEVWKTIDQTARAMGTGHELSDRLRRIVCTYCRVANPVGASSCVACGAPLGDSQPTTCRHCGFVLRNEERVCPNCKRAI